MASPITCPGCGTALADDADPRRRTCSDRCRKRTARARRLAERERLEEAAEAAATEAAELRRLFAAQARAAMTGDSAALASIAREAVRLGISST